MHKPWRDVKSGKYWVPIRHFDFHNARYSIPVHLSSQGIFELPGDDERSYRFVANLLSIILHLAFSALPIDIFQHSSTLSERRGQIEPRVSRDYHVPSLFPLEAKVFCGLVPTSIRSVQS